MIPAVPLSVDAVQLRLTWLHVPAVTVNPVGTEGGAVSMLTVNMVAADVELFPAASNPLAVQACVPLSELETLQPNRYGGVDDDPLKTPPS